MEKKLTAAALRALELIKGPRGEAFRYVAVGVCTTFVDYASFHLMDRVLCLNLDISNVMSTALAVLFAYAANRTVVFQSRTKGLTALAEFFKFIASRLFTMVLEVAGVYLFVDVLGQDSLIGKAEAIVIVIVANYFFSKFLVFRKHKAPPETM